jgi:rRNA maturation endonuclease Nob1
VITVDEEDEDSEFVRVRKHNWVRLIQKVWKDDPEVCPQCGSRTKIKTHLVMRGTT